MNFQETYDHSIPGTSNTPNLPLKNNFDNMIAELKPVIDTKINLSSTEYNDALDHYFQPSQPSSAHPESTNVSSHNPIVKASLENIKAFEESLKKDIEQTVNTTNVDGTGSVNGSGSQTPTNINSPIIQTDYSPSISKPNMFSTAYPRLGLRFNANNSSPIENFFHSNSSSQVQVTTNLLEVSQNSFKGKFAAHLNDNFDNIKSNVIPELINLPDTPTVLDINYDDN
jgi:hypothetical protein